MRGLLFTSCSVSFTSLQILVTFFLLQCCVENPLHKRGSFIIKVSPVAIAVADGRRAEQMSVIECRWCTGGGSYCAHWEIFRAGWTCGAVCAWSRLALRALA